MMRAGLTMNDIFQKQTIDMSDISIIEWLETDCIESEIMGDHSKGYYLGIDTVKSKIRQMEKRFQAIVDISSFNHFFFTNPDKSVIASGSLEVMITHPDIVKCIVGAATFDMKDYDGNTHYAATLKSLCICNAMLQFPQFGSKLNKEFVPTIQQKGPDKKEEVYDSQVDEEWGKLKVMLDQYDNKEDAATFLSTTDFKYTIEAQEIVNSKPPKI